LYFDKKFGRGQLVIIQLNDKNRRKKRAVGFATLEKRYILQFVNK
jgi:hypothetical protein